VLDQGWKDLCHPYDLIEATARWRHSVATGEPYEVHFRLLRGSDRQFRWHVGRALAVRQPNGAVDYWAGSNCDIDSVKRAEEVASSMALQSRAELDRLTAG
jgi:PAS domain-containing protein